MGSGFPIHIPMTKARALEETVMIWNKTTVYSDRSGQDRQIGAVAVLCRNGVEWSMLRVYLGSADQHTVYKAELLGLSLAAKLIRTESGVLSNHRHSQATILVTWHSRGSPCQHLMDRFNEQMATV